MTYCLDIEAVIEISKAPPIGGALLDRGALDGALARPMHTAFGQDLYPSVMEKAAVLLHGVAGVHAFIDGNKRTAWICCVTFLALHDIDLAPMPDEEAGQFVVDVTRGTIDHHATVQWLLDHVAPDVAGSI